jgi:two-component system, sensor histidine kinase PdtaS
MCFLVQYRCLPSLPWSFVIRGDPVKSAGPRQGQKKRSSPVTGGEAEESLPQREAQLDAILQTSPIPKFVIDKNHRVISWNKAMANVTGIEGRTVLGTNTHWKAFYPAERPCLADLLLDGSFEKIPELYAGTWKKSEVAEGAYEATGFFPHIRPRGKWLHFIAAPITDNDGSLIGATETLEDVTDLVRAQQELHESEERYSALFSNNYSVSLLIDPDTGRIVDANDAAVQYYGYPHDQLTALGIYDLNRLSKDTVIRNLRRAKTEKEKHFFSTHYRADGEKRYVEIYSGPIPVRGKPLFYSIIHDITDRKRAETELQKSQYLLSEALEMANMADWEMDGQTGVFTFNDRFWSLYATTAEREGGYQMPAEVYAREFVHPDDQHLVGEEIAKAVAAPESGYHSLREHRIIRRDGEVRYIIVRIRITKDAEGRTIKTHGANQDITDRKRAEQALGESEERYRTLVDQLPDYVIVHRDGILLYVNPAAASRFGYTAETLVGKPILSFIAPGNHDTVRQAVVRRMAGSDVPAYEMKIRQNDGTYRTVLTNGAAIMFEGRPASLNVLTDITDRKLMEEEVQSLNRVLEQRVKDRTEALSKTNEQLTAEIAARAHAEQEVIKSLQEKDLLLREIHHRVKNNLQIIASLLNLQSRYITDPNVLEAIRGSQGRIRAMALVHERIYRSYNIAEINLRDYLNYLTQQIFQFYNIQQHLIGITVTMDDILADIDTITPLGLIINELVSNSLKYAFPEGRKGHITLECTRLDPDRLRILYHDDGIGMPAGFDWKNTESLGLRLVNSLVDQLNGTIETGEGGGTTFIITIRQKREPSPS